MLLLQMVFYFATMAVKLIADIVVVNAALSFAVNASFYDGFLLVATVPDAALHFVITYALVVVCGCCIC